MMTESVGFPPTANAFTPLREISCARMGSKMEMERPTALCWVAGATMVTDAMGLSAS